MRWPLTCVLLFAIVGTPRFPCTWLAIFLAAPGICEFASRLPIFVCIAPPLLMGGGGRGALGGSGLTGLDLLSWLSFDFGGGGGTEIFGGSGLTGRFLLSWISLAPEIKSSGASRLGEHGLNRFGDGGRGLSGGPGVLLPGVGLWRRFGDRGNGLSGGTGLTRRFDMGGVLEGVLFKESVSVLGIMGSGLLGLKAGLFFLLWSPFVGFSVPFWVGGGGGVLRGIVLTSDVMWIGISGMGLSGGPGLGGGSIARPRLVDLGGMGAGRSANDMLRGSVWPLLTGTPGSDFLGGTGSALPWGVGTDLFGRGFCCWGLRACRGGDRGDIGR